MAKRHVAPLVSGPVRLRLVEKADLPMTLFWRNQDHIRKWFLSKDVISEGQHLAWYERYKDRDDDFVFIIEETESFRRPIGQVSAYAIDCHAGQAKVGRLLIGDPEAVGCGFAKAAVARLVDETFASWGLRELSLECFVDNAAARAVYEACGFRVTSHLTESVLLMRRGGSVI